MVDLNHRYALLEDGRIIALFSPSGIRYHKTYTRYGLAYVIIGKPDGIYRLNIHYRILATANNKPWLKIHKTEIIETGDANET